MVGFTLLSRSYYYLRRQSPGPPFPPDHRQAGEPTGGYKRAVVKKFRGLSKRGSAQLAALRACAGTRC